MRVRMELGLPAIPKLLCPVTRALPDVQSSSVLPPDAAALLYSVLIHDHTEKSLSRCCFCWSLSLGCTTTVCTAPSNEVPRPGIRMSLVCVLPCRQHRALERSYPYLNIRNTERSRSKNTAQNKHQRRSEVGNRRGRKDYRTH